MTKNKIIIKKQEIDDAINKMAQRIIPQIKNNEIGFIGIIKRGDIIANRIKKIIKKKYDYDIPVGKIDINLYRDDLSIINNIPKIEYTSIPFDLNNKIIFLIDDVFFTGRTIRCALNEIMDFGRPRRIILYTLVDRKSRELPIMPDYSPIIYKGNRNDIINVYLKEIDNKDQIIIIKEAI